MIQSLGFSGIALAALLASGYVAGTEFNYGESAHAQGIVWRGIDVDDPDRPQNRLWFDFIRLGEERARGVRGVGQLDILPVGDYYPVARVDGMGLEMIVPRAFARPGDRWVDIFLAWDAGLDGSETVELAVALMPVGSSDAVEQRRFEVEEWHGQLLVDLRRHGLQQGRVLVELIANGERRAVGEVFIAAHPGHDSLILADGVRVDVDEANGLPADQRLPVTFGVPFAAGSLWDAGGLKAVDSRGRAVPAQIEVVGRWAPDGAIKWVRVDALPIPRDGLFITRSAVAEPVRDLPSLTLERRGDRVVVDTGKARYELGTGLSPIVSIRRNGVQVAAAENARGLYVVDQTGRLAQASADGQSMTVESSGPVAACVRFEGFYRTADGEQLARHITRVELFAGRADAKVTHTLILTRDTNEVWFRDIGWEFAVMPGANPEAVLGVDRLDKATVLTQSLEDPIRSVHSLQAEHLRFGAGDNRFVVASEAVDGTETLILEGEEMGDWALLQGEQGGLFAAVRDAALQHPKEFELTADLLTIRLFSNRAGEELDFRAATLVDKWHLPEFFGDQQIPVRETVAAIESNAIGWAKTHELMLAPMAAADDAVATATRLAILNADKVYAHVDPRWIYSTDAMGPLYPKDAAAHPELEKLVDELVEVFTSHLRGTSFYGFVDYNAGPSFTPRGSRGDLARERRFLGTYQLRPELWGVYARSGERSVRSFTEQTNRAWADNKIAHWSAPGKTRGLYMEGRNAGPPLPHLGSGDLPFYWQDGTVFNMQDGTNLNQIINDYFLTGNRRAGDIIHQYVDGIIEAWTPVAVASRKRKTESFWAMVQAYGATNNPELRPIAESTASFVYDPEGVTALTSAKELSATYKARTSARALIDGWEIFGTPPYYDMAMRIGEHKWLRYLGRPSVWGTTSPFGVLGNFLLRETGSPHYAKWLEIALRRAQLESVTASPFRATFITSGIPAALYALAGTTPAEMRRVSWAAWQDDDQRPVSVVVYKGVYDTVDVYIQTVNPGDVRSGEWIRPLSEPTLRSRDRSLISLSTSSNLPPAPHGHIAAQVNLPKDSPVGDYEIIPLHPGTQWVAAQVTPPSIIHDEPRGRGWTQPYTYAGFVPMALHAPEGWTTAATPARVYFKLPKDAASARVFFSEPTPLFTPDDQPFADGEPLSGWVELPTDTPGLWSFELDGTPREIQVDGMPPFFTFDEPRTFMTVD